MIYLFILILFIFEIWAVTLVMLVAFAVVVHGFLWILVCSLALCPVKPLCSFALLAQPAACLALLELTIDTCLYCVYLT